MGIASIFSHVCVMENVNLPKDFAQCLIYALTGKVESTPKPAGQMSGNPTNRGLAQVPQFEE
jgi:hypothetical protein